MPKRKINKEPTFDVMLGVDCVCPICGKQFLALPEWVYKRNRKDKGGTKYLCSYKCTVAWDKQNPPKRAGRKKKTIERDERIYRLYHQGHDVDKLAEIFGLTVKTVRKILGDCRI